MRTTPFTIFTALTLSGLVLAGCSSEKDASAEDATSATAAASGSASTSASAESSATALPTLANGKEVELSDEERVAFEAGEYVAATENHPALNVPVPVMPEAAKEQSFEGAKAFIEYMVSLRNYAAETGKYQDYVNNSEPGNLTGEIDFLKQYSRIYAQGGWVVGSKTSINVPDYGFTAETENLKDVLVVESREIGYIHDDIGKKQAEVEAFNLENQPTQYTLKWEGSNWVLNQFSGVEGVQYEN